MYICVCVCVICVSSFSSDNFYCWVFVTRARESLSHSLTLSVSLCLAVSLHTSHQCPEDWPEIERLVSGLDGETVLLFNVNERQPEFYNSKGEETGRPVVDGDKQCAVEPDWPDSVVSNW